MNDDRKIIILDRVKYIAEHFDELSDIDLITLFVACATLFEETDTKFYQSFIRVMQQTVQAKLTNKDPRDVQKYLEDNAII
ncbi:hypothetical protein H9L01_01515 [Erysipelothrix inopinata]|uniref:Uncharacterized protein n=1 Tax=Erysipelothrix inopinata TaxID=225084 RepID=A0A7G9RZP5_9FIRM|nr:hypothetical protein [Erysipelothrix inopinata]QNN61070.1 hypothetical protein H9L01_01515 [Erysipelothrix inopinata]